MANQVRTVVKIGSSSLTRSDGGLDLNRIDQVARLIANTQARAEQIVLVSSGAISAGLGQLRIDERPRDLASAQAVAAVGQGRLMAAWTQALSVHGVPTGQVLLSAADVVKRTQYSNAQRALEKLLAMGVVPIVNENDAVATDEIRFGDNDRLAAIVSHLVRADTLILATDVDGLYDRHPKTAGARLIPEITSSAQLKSVEVCGRGTHLGTGGMVTKIAAALMATSNGTRVVLTSADNLAPALHRQPVGTQFAVSGQRRGSRRLWLAYAANSVGQLHLDAGAAKAVTDAKKSLLVAGVTSVSGQFPASAVVELVDSDGDVLARGFSSYSSREILELIGRGKLDDCEPKLRPVVHRDDLAEIRY